MSLSALYGNYEGLELRIMKSPSKKVGNINYGKKSQTRFYLCSLKVVSVSPSKTFFCLLKALMCAASSDQSVDVWRFFQMSFYPQKKVEVLKKRPL